jgi:sialic acid synthase
MRNTYIIGEIGQNHNGSVDIAKAIIDLAASEILDDYRKLKGIDAIKLTKRDLNQELSKSQMNNIYDSPHSFGRTYGEHRQYLELSDKEHYEIYQFVKEKRLDLVETICAKGALSLLKLFTPDSLKVASRDVSNIPLLEAMAETHIPIILSTGMSGKQELDNALNIISKHHNKISILHCVSEYPTKPENVNLKTITYLLKSYPEYTIGYSDHTIGIMTPVAAVAMGAKLIEKHITLDRRMKGTDQAGSLGPDGIYRMIRDIRLLDNSLGVEGIFIEEAVIANMLKLERSIAVNRDMKTGEIITEDDIHLLSPGDGFKWMEKDKIIGKIISRDIDKNEILYRDFINNDA